MKTELGARIGWPVEMAFHAIVFFVVNVAFPTGGMVLLTARCVRSKNIGAPDVAGLVYELMANHAIVLHFG